MFYRDICKVIYKLFFPKSLRHNRHYWPFYKVERDQYDRIQKVYYKGQLISDNRINFPESKITDKCVLVATGPSVKQLPPEIFHLHDVDYIGVNGAIALDSIQFSTYVIIDRRFVENRFDLVEKVLKTNCTLFTTARCLDSILRKVGLEYIICNIKVIEPITYGLTETFLGSVKPVNLQEKDFFVSNQFGFSNDIYKGVFDCFTVPYVALQIIQSLKYKEIYIAGLDMNNFSQPRFYEISDNQQSTQLTRHIPEIFEAFDIAAEFFGENGVKVWNLSQDSAIEAFEKIDASKLLKN